MKFHKDKISLLDNKLLAGYKNINMFLAAFFFLTGLLFFIFPIATSVVVGSILSWFLLLSGVFMIISALSILSFSNKLYTFLSIVLGFAYGIVGFQLLSRPDRIIIYLGALIGILFLISGISKIFMSFLNMYFEKSWFFLVSGIIESILGFIIIQDWPTDSPFIVPLIFGIQFLFIGIDCFTLSQFFNKSLPNQEQ